VEPRNSLEDVAKVGHQDVELGIEVVDENRNSIKVRPLRTFLVPNLFPLAGIFFSPHGWQHQGIRAKETDIVFYLVKPLEQICSDRIRGKSLGCRNLFDDARGATDVSMAFRGISDVALNVSICT
jgi:hypothetical protein